MSRARAKSTRSENERAEYYRRWFPQAARVPGGQASMDIVGCPFPVEDKSTAAPRFIEWFKHYNNRHGARWVLHWHGDRRTFSGTFVLMPEEMLAELLDLAYRGSDAG